jgi:hypothetical protein
VISDTLHRRSKTKSGKDDKRNGKVALLVRLEAKPGKSRRWIAFFVEGYAIVQEEPATTVWFALRLGPSTFESSMPFRTRRTASSPGGARGCRLMAQAAELLAQPPVIERSMCWLRKLA